MDPPLDPPLRLSVASSHAQTLDEASGMLQTFLDDFEARTAAPGVGGAGAAGVGARGASNLTTGALGRLVANLAREAQQSRKAPGAA